MEALQPFRIQQVTVNQDDIAINQFTVEYTAQVVLVLDRKLCHYEQREVYRAFSGYSGKGRTLDQLQFLDQEIHFETRSDDDAVNFVKAVADHSEVWADRANEAIGVAGTRLSSLEADLAKVIATSAD